jgi:chemotaxis protein MotA
MPEGKSASGPISRKKSRGGADLGSIGGLAIAVLGIVGGLTLEGGHLRDVAQLTAAMIVLGGTIGAVLVSMPFDTVRAALRRVKDVFFNRAPDTAGIIEQLIGYAAKARKTGLVSLEDEAYKIDDPFLKKALMLAVDGTDLQEMRKMLELVIEVEEHHADAEAKVFECAGGYAPTIGIIGAVLGLIQVMKNLANIDEVGHGIAGAFVATVYGVASANLFFLPIATKIRARFEAEVRRKEIVILAISGIIEGLNPKLISMNLDAYVAPQSGSQKKAEKKNAAVGAKPSSPAPAGALKA